MPTNPVTNRYYPKLSEVMTIEDMPEVLAFVQDGLDDLIDSVHYKNLQYSRSARGDSAFYSLDIVSNNIGLDLPFGLRLVLNPDTGGDTTISSFPVSLQYQWELLAFLRSVSLQNFSFEPDAFFELGLQIFKISDEQVLANALNFFVTPASPSVTKYQQLVADINAQYPGANLSLPAGVPPTVTLIVQLINANTSITVDIPELIFTVYILNTDTSITEQRLQQFYNIVVPAGIKDYIQKLIKPKVKATLTLSAGIEFPATILQPVTDAGVIISNTKSIFKFAEATFYVDSEAGIGSQLDLGGSLIPTHAQIGNTGLVITFDTAKLDLSRTTNIPEADAAGYPVDFTGIYIKEAGISFNKFGDDNTGSQPSAVFTVDNLFIGTGGVSGTFKLETNTIRRKFGNFEVELDKFSVTFRQNTITVCQISGKLTLPSSFNTNGTPTTLDIEINITDDGDFSIAAMAQTTLPTFTLPQVFTLALRKLEFGRKNNLFYIGVAGTLDFIADIPVLGQILPKGINITKLLIYEDGSLEFDGGGLVVPTSFKLSVGPVKLEVSHMSLGPYKGSLEGLDRTGYFFGFDGMVNLGIAGIEATGQGIKYYFTHDDKPFRNFITIDGLEIDITIPDNASEDTAAVILKGSLSMKNPSADHPDSQTQVGEEYTGKISFAMPRIGVDGTAAMRLNPSIPSFVVDIGLELPTAIPLGPTGLGIYAFRGLVGKHYVPSREAAGVAPDATWWEYYKAPQAGINIDKLEDESGFSVGAGVSLATDVADSGFIFSAKLFLLLGLPDVFLIEGQGGVLRHRLGLDGNEDPPFRALIVFSDQSILGNLAIDYQLPGGGFIASVKAELDLGFFFNNASGWYLNIGQDTPTSKQVQAKLLTLFNGHAYFMISSQGFKAGAGISFAIDKKFGPVGFNLGAYLDMGGFISFKPVQIGGFIKVGGSAGIHLFWFKLGVAIDFALAVEAPNPFNITGSLHVQIKTPAFLPNINFTLSLSWHPASQGPSLLTPLDVFAPDPANGYSPVAAVNILTNEIFPINYLLTQPSDGSIPQPGDSGWQYNFSDPTQVMQVTIPLDSFIDIELLKAVIPTYVNGTVPNHSPADVPIGGESSQLPQGYTELLPPKKGIANQVKHQYEITKLAIYAWNAGTTTWVSYNVYEAVTAIAENYADPTGLMPLSGFSQGYWQFSSKDTYSKIRLLSQNMFSYMNSSVNDQSNLDSRNFQGGDVFCYDRIAKDIYVNWLAVAAGTLYPQNSPVDQQQVTFTFQDINASVVTESSYGGTALKLSGNEGIVEIKLPVSVTALKLEFGDNNNSIRVDFIRDSWVPVAGFNRPLLADDIVFTTNIRPDQQHENISVSTGVTINRIRLTIQTPQVPDYEGDLIIGGHVALATGVTGALNPDLENDKSLLFTTIYNRSFLLADVQTMGYSGVSGTVVQWVGNAVLGAAGGLNGVLSGSPDLVTGFYLADGAGGMLDNQRYLFEGTGDALVVLYDPLLKVENESFAIETTAVFEPFNPGISTLLSKVKTDDETGYQHGFTLHLLQPVLLNPGQSYQTPLPEFTLILSFYNGLTISHLTVTEAYTVDCASFQIEPVQYKRILFSVNRENGQLDIFVDRELKLSTPIPAELGVFSEVSCYTFLNEIQYVTESDQARLTDANASADATNTEVRNLNNALNKTIQPVWRPDTIFAVKITTQDRVNQTSPVPQTHTFGFKTAGPIGHFHQESAIYQQLVSQDQAEAFKLADLRFYIDYNRSFPDAQGRYNLSKPVFYGSPVIGLFFTEPYLNAMYADWDSYEGLPAVQSSLKLQLLDTAGNALDPAPASFDDVSDPITVDNYQTLPPDQQALFLLYLAAFEAENPCTSGPNSFSLTRKIQRRMEVFGPVTPNSLYIARYTSLYRTSDDTADQVSEVYRFSFLTSRYVDFSTQANSFILDATAGAERYAIYPQELAFSAADMDVIRTIVTEDPDLDHDFVQQYAVLYEQLLFGGLHLPTPETFEYSVIKLLINTDPADATSRKLIGIWIYNPEPFNDPKLPQDLLPGTIISKLTLTDGSPFTGELLYFYSRDNAGVLITNADMDMPAGSLQLTFTYKMFDGVDYQNQPIAIAPINLTPYFEL